MNPIAVELNDIIKRYCPDIYCMMSDVGKKLFFPKGILTQSAEAKEKAHRLNATIGIALEEGKTMRFNSVAGLVHEMRPKEYLTYAPSFGIPGLRQIWKEDLYRKNPSLSGKSVSLPVVTSGITHAISVFADMWVNPDDVIVLPDMMWGNYTMIFNVLHNARISQYPLFSDAGGFNLSALEEKLREEARDRDKVIVLLNFPQNPTGYSANHKEGDAIVEILTRLAEDGTHVIAVTDDAYFGLFYEDDTLKESLFAKLCGKHPRLLAVKLDGATKESYVWGLRVGFITYGCAPQQDEAAVYDALVRKTAGCVRGTISNASHLGQSIILRSMQDLNFPVEKEEKFRILKARAMRVKSVLTQDKYKEAFEAYPFNSGYFMCIRLKHANAENLRVHLLDRYGVGLIAIGEDNLRIAFSCIEEDNIQELFDIILRGVKDLTG
ncbi:MAG: aminotransferase class I/II-fold pyridoxal phosphate-dependent enzyme [Desulfobacterales bacterium]